MLSLGPLATAYVTSAAAHPPSKVLIRGSLGARHLQNTVGRNGNGPLESKWLEMAMPCVDDEDGGDGDGDGDDEDDDDDEYDDEYDDADDEVSDVMLPMVMEKPCMVMVAVAVTVNTMRMLP